MVDFVDQSILRDAHGDHSSTLKSQIKVHSLWVDLSWFQESDTARVNQEDWEIERYRKIGAHEERFASYLSLRDRFSSPFVWHEPFPVFQTMTNLLFLGGALLYMCPKFVTHELWTLVRLLKIS